MLDNLLLVSEGFGIEGAFFTISSFTDYFFSIKTLGYAFGGTNGGELSSSSESKLIIALF